MHRIDVHAHLLPGVDDGSRSMDESIAIARAMVAAGYAELVCTPHVWPHLGNDATIILRRVAALQTALDDANVPLKLHPGGEMNVGPHLLRGQPVTYAMRGRHTLFDFWDTELPPEWDDCIAHLRSHGIQPILAHPERIDAFQLDPDLIDVIQSQHIWLQCNLECLGDEKPTARRTLAERWLVQGRYFMLGSDLHRIDTLPRRLSGLRRATELVGPDIVHQLTHTHPSRLLEE
jgi:protein-tyrosine phosphatase